MSVVKANEKNHDHAQKNEKDMHDFYRPWMNNYCRYMSREPEFLDIVKEPPVIETEEQTGRTVASGIRRRNKVVV